MGNHIIFRSERKADGTAFESNSTEFPDWISIRSMSILVLELLSIVLQKLCYEKIEKCSIYLVCLFLLEGFKTILAQSGIVSEL